MKTRAAPLIGAVVSLVLSGIGPCHALSLRSSAAEAFLGDASPGTTVVYSRAKGGRLRVENTGPSPIRIDFKAVPPPLGELKDGYEPWTGPIRLEPERAEVGPGQAAETDASVRLPKKAAEDGQYEFVILATGRDRAGASLTLKTRVLLSAGAPLASAADAAGGFADRPGFSLSPSAAAGLEATVKIVNAGDEDLTVRLSPARDWSDEVRLEGGEEPAPNPRWLRFEPGVVKVRAGAIGRARIWASVPPESRYAGRSWAFVAAVDAEAGGRRTRRYFTLHAKTAAREETKRAR